MRGDKGLELSRRDVAGRGLALLASGAQSLVGLVDLGGDVGGQAGILGGSVSPPIVGWLKDYTGNFSGGLYALAGFGLLAAIVAAVAVRETPAPKRVPEAAAVTRTVRRPVALRAPA